MNACGSRQVVHSSLISHNSLANEKPQPSPIKPNPTSFFHHSASFFLLAYLGVYAFLGCSNLLLGQYQILDEIFYLDM
ncbi:hypothetical protein DSO57_1032394, partial [Entomophthora muscae]